MQSIDSDGPPYAAPGASLVLLPGLDGSGVLFRPLLWHLGIGIRPIVMNYPADRPLGYQQLLLIVLAAVPTAQVSHRLMLGLGNHRALVVAAVDMELFADVVQADDGPVA